MKRILQYWGWMIICLAVLGACSGMDKTYEEFLGSSTTYVGKVKNVVAYPGNNRIMLAWDPVTDPRAVEVEISWANGQHSVTKPIISRADTSVIVGPLDEGSYSFNIKTRDDLGNSSLAVAVSGEVYGDFYQSTLANRLVQSVSLNEGDGSLTVNFHQAVESAFQKQDVFYFSSREQDTVVVSVSRNENVTVLPDYDSETFRVVSFFNPNGIDFDIFSSTSTIEYTPSVPYPILPIEGITDASCCPKFEWKAILGRDDPGLYEIHISEDGSDWTTYVPKEAEQFRPRHTLKPNTRYYWKVTANDLESEIRTFTTGNKDMYGDGELVVLSTQTQGNAPSNFVFIGEGFSQDEYKVNGVFDRAVKEAYTTLFKIEPYKSYRNYFNVYQVTAYAEIAGISAPSGTVFGTVLDEATNTLACDRTKVNAFLEKVGGWDISQLNNTCVIVVVNADVDAGMTYYYTGGQTISLCPTFNNPENIPFADYRYIVVRQAGGFGYGWLGDESVNSQEEIPETGRAELEKLWEQHRALNLDLVPETGSAEGQVRWKDFIGKPGYEKVKATYEGGFGYRKGVLRSEQSSAMDESRLPYFSTASRVAIVQRILRVAGEEYTHEKFLEQDYTGIAPDL